MTRLVFFCPQLDGPTLGHLDHWLSKGDGGNR